MISNNLPEWLINLEDEDFVFIKNFILASGSLKDLAKKYGVTYPTVRLRLDRLIQKIQLNSDNSDDSFMRLLKKLAIDEKLDFDTAKMLSLEYNKNKKGWD